jgi:uncharacterized membrane protein
MRALPRLTLLAAACSSVVAFANPTDVHPNAQSGDTYARAVSGDGSTIVGTDTSTGGFRAFRIINGSYSLLSLNAQGSTSTAASASADGNVIVGQTDILGINYAAIWTNGNLSVLPLNGAVEMAATAVSADGLTVVGWSVDGASRSDAFYRDSGNFIFSLATEFGPLHSRATGVSGDGSLIVGTVSDDLYGTRGARSGFIYQ